MSEVITLFRLNILLLLKDKVSLVWSLLLPTIMLFINSKEITSINNLSYWWIYIVFNSFIYGVGVFALQEKDSGALSIIFSIKWIPKQFFFGLLLTQILYSLFCLALFNIIPVVMFNFNYIELMFFSLLAILITIPVAFVGYNTTYFKNLYASTISSICNILVFLCFIIINVRTPFNFINSFLIIGNELGNFMDGKINLIYIIISLLLIVISLPSIIYFKPLSNESR